MASQEKIATVESEAKEQAGECCDPVCGPTTCEPAVEAKAEEEPKKASSGCGPSTCS